MPSSKRYNKETEKWEIIGTSQASELAILDIQDNFIGTSVEEALREVSDSNDVNSAKLHGVELAVESTNSRINTLSSDFNEHITNHPGGSGGSGGCKITSTFEGGVIDSDTDLYIPIFFTPSVGAINGTVFIMINNVEVGTQMIERGNNSIHIGVLPSIKNDISIYARDNKGAMSEQLTWEVIKGGIDFTLNFDYNVDYGIDDVIRAPYVISSPLDSQLILEITIDNVKTEFPINKQGYGEYIFTGLGIGVHPVTMIVTSGIYRSKMYSFNLVIVSSYNLYVSTTFKGGEYESGVPVIFDYRISKLSSELFDVELKLNNVTQKTLQLPSGSYTWTIPSLSVGQHNIKVEVRSTSSEYSSVNSDVSIFAGEYIPVTEVTGGLIANFSSQTMTNNDINKDVWTDLSGNNVLAKLHNFNFNTNGWIEVDASNGRKERVLRCDNEAYVEINLKPYETNAKLGSTIDILYKAKNIGIEDARILDYTGVDIPYKGVYSTINGATFKSIVNTGTVSLDEDTETRLTFVIDRTNKFAIIYVNGVISRAFYLSDSGSGVNATYEDFSHNQKIYLNSLKGISGFGAVDIKRLRVYGRALSSDEVIQNHLADIEDITTQKNKYKFNFENTSTPKIKIYCPEDQLGNMSGTTDVTCRVKYESPNEDFFGASFDLPKCDVRWQGTSSLQYVLKNYTIRLKDENLAPYYYTPYKNGIPESIFCMKADYMESSHAHNVGMAKFINECLYDTKTPAQLQNSKTRTTIDGFPILLYINDELKGAYNFNLDRYSTESFGYKNFPKLLAYEVSANSDTTAGAFYKWSSTTGKTEIDYYKSDFEILYPYSRENNDNFAELIRLVNWVDSASDELFKEQIHEYFNLEYLLRYYLCVMVIGAVDSLGKNMKLISYDGLIWYPQFYDLDTILGLDNTGFLKFDSDIEVQPGTFNTSTSKLWTKVARIFAVELQQQYALMRLDRFTVNNMMKYIYGEQISAIPERNYNIDMKTKYLNFGSTYLFACHGNREQHIRKWIRERLVYTDTLMKYFGSTNDYITLRANKLGYVYLDIQTYLPMYLTVKWRDEPDIIVGGQVINNGRQTKRVGKGETTRFEFNMPTSTDQEVIIYAGRYLKSIGDVSNLRPSTLLLANATRLTSLTCHSDELENTDISNLITLQNVDLSDCPSLGTAIGTSSTLNMTKCIYLKKINFYNTSLTAIQLNSNGGSVEEIYYPKTVQSIDLYKQERLKVVGIPYDIDNGIECTNLATVNINNCPNIERFTPTITSGDTFQSLKHVQNLILNNATKLSSMSFGAFKRLSSVTLTNMKYLVSAGFDDMNNYGDTAILGNVVIQNCPLITDLTFNVTSSNKTILFTPNAKLDLSQAYTLKRIISNTGIQGLTTIILNQGVQDVILAKTFGSNNSSIKNLWSYSTVTSNQNDNYLGIDFKDLNVKNLDLGSALLIPSMKNFKITPTTTMNIQGSRDGITYPFLPVDGIIDLSNYTGSCANLFKNVDLSNVTIIKNNDFTQTDFTSMFEGATISSNTDMFSIMNKIKNAVNCTRMFANSNINIPYIPNAFGVKANLTEMFMDCNNITSADIVLGNTVSITTSMFKNCTSLNGAIPSIPSSVTNAEYMFQGCTSLTELSDWTFAGTYPIDINKSLFINTGIETVRNIVLTSFSNTNNGAYGVFENCPTLKYVYGFRIEGEITHVQRVFLNCVNLIRVEGLFIGGKGTGVHDGNDGNTLSIFNAKKELLYAQIELGNNITKTVSLFNNCNKLSEVDIRMTNNVVMTRYMFQNCWALEYDNINLNGWTGSSATDVRGMFVGCRAFVDISPNFDFRNATTVANLFDSCINLKKIDASNILLSSKLTNISRMFGACSNITEVVMPTGMLDTKITSLEGIFVDGKNTLTKLVNFKVPQTVVSSGFCFGGLGGFTISKLEDTTGMEIHSQTLLDLNRTSNGSRDCLFKGSNIKRITDIKFGGNVTDISSLLEGCTNLVEDIEIPSNLLNVTNVFKNCTKMTHVTSNWKKTYDGDIVTTDAYAGCTGITHVDEVLVTNEYSTGLDEIPTKWGGYGFTKDVTGIFRVVIPSDNYTLELPSVTLMIDSQKINWGDGNATTGIKTNTYAMAGEYIIKGHFHWNSNINGSAFGDILTEVIQIGNNKRCRLFFLKNVKKANLIGGEISTQDFNSCSSLEEVNVTDCKILGNSLSVTFQSCSKLHTITGLETWDTSNISQMNGLFLGCASLGNVDLSGWNISKVANTSEMFNGCSNMTTIDLSMHTFNNINNITAMFKNCSSLTTLKLPKINTVQQAIHHNYNYNVFEGCSSLKTIDNIDNIQTKYMCATYSWFKNCTSLTHINLGALDLSLSSSLDGMFEGCTSLVSVDFSNVISPTLESLQGNTLSNKLSMSGMFRLCTSLKTQDNLIGFDKFNFNTVGNMNSMFDASGIIKLDIRNWDTSNVTTFTSFCNANMSLREIHLNFNGIYQTLFHTSSDVELIGFHNCTMEVRDYLFPFAARGKFELDMTNVTITDMDASGGRMYDNKVISAASLIKWLAALADRTSTTIGTCTIGATNLAKLTPEQVRIATDKNWSVV